eukprot:2638113-Rhodomonas_salina.2
MADAQSIMVKPRRVVKVKGQTDLVDQEVQVPSEHLLLLHVHVHLLLVLRQRLDLPRILRQPKPGYDAHARAHALCSDCSGQFEWSVVTERSTAQHRARALRGRLTAHLFPELGHLARDLACVLPRLNTTPCVSTGYSRGVCVGDCGACAQQVAEAAPCFPCPCPRAPLSSASASGTSSPRMPPASQTSVSESAKTASLPAKRNGVQEKDALSHRQ